MKAKLSFNSGVAFEIHRTTLYQSWVKTPLGSMLAIADEKELLLLEFEGLEREIERLRKNYTITSGSTKPIESIKRELTSYFAGSLKHFETPIRLLGTPFQKTVWEELLRIPYGETRSYAEEAEAIGKPSAFRAVANANGANQLAIIVPCHRVINKNGKFGGYGGGLERKRWLIEHETRAIHF